MENQHLVVDSAKSFDYPLVIILVKRIISIKKPN
jgi:hypothetical protein